MLMNLGKQQVPLIHDVEIYTLSRLPHPPTPGLTGGLFQGKWGTKKILHGIPKILTFNTAKCTQESMESDSMWGSSVCAAGHLPWPEITT